MNCNNFEAIISDLAREQMLEAQTRESALSHVEECAACAAMLEDEQALTNGLRSLALSMEQLEAPAPLEASLLAKFREQRAAQSLPIVVQMPQRTFNWQRFIPQAVAAAVILMFAIGGASMLRLRLGQQQQPASQSKALAGNNNKAASQAMPVNTAESQPGAGEIESTAVATAADNTDNVERGRKLSKNGLVAIMGPTTTRRTGSQRVPRSGIGESGMTSTSGEIATDFMPVSYGDNLNEIDNGRIVRVEMPRSALAQFGLPVNMDRAGERIKADVLIGDDGMARAIRFVR
jgi:hypothetical protein